MEPVDRVVSSAVLAGAVATGIRAGSPSYALLEIWTGDRPPTEMFRAWRQFIAALCRDLTVDERRNLRDKLVGRARAVAEAAGDTRRDDSNVSPEEAALLEDLERTFFS